MKKIRVVFCFILLIVLLCGCSGTASVKKNTIMVHKDGSVTGAIVETFDKEYYDKDSLKEFTLQEVAAYNKKVGKDKISVKKLNVKKGKVVLYLGYKDSVAYKEFNKKELFAGTVAEAYDAGYDLNVSLINANDKTDVIGKEKLLELGSNHIVIYEEAVNVETNGRILYASDDVTVTGRRTAEKAKEGLSYIVYK